MKRKLVLSALLIWKIGTCFSAREIESKPYAVFDSSGKEMEQLIHSFSGNWFIEFAITPTEGLPKGGKGQGQETWKPGPGKLSLIEEYHSRGDDGDNAGQGVFWWDEKLHRYQVLWCANDVPGGCVLISDGASWQGNQLVLLNQWESGGKKQMLKEVFSDITPTTFTQTIYQGENSGTLRPVFICRAKKKLKPPRN